MSAAPATEDSARRAATRSPGCCGACARCGSARCWPLPLGWLGVVYLGSLIVLLHLVAVVARTSSRG